MSKIDASICGQNHRLCQRTGIASAQSGRSSLQHRSDLRAHHLRPSAPTQVTLSRQTTTRPEHIMCYSAPKVRLPRSVGELSGDTTDSAAISSATVQRPDVNQGNVSHDDDEDQDHQLQAGIAIIEQISDRAVQQFLGRYIVALSRSDQVGQDTWRSLTDLEKMSGASAEIEYILHRQPSPQQAAKEAFQSKLELAFPAAPRPLLPDQIHITQYAEQNDIVTTTLSQTLTQALQQSMRSAYGTATYNQTRTGFFSRPNEVAADNEIPGMKGSQHLLAFEKILQEESSPNTRSHNYQQALQDFWNTPDDTRPGHTPATWLSRQYYQQRLAETQLRLDDGTLTSAAKKWITYLADPMRATVQPGTFSLSLQDGTDNIPFSGIMVFTRRPNENPDNTTGSVLLAIPGQGLMSFATSTAYQEALQEIFDDTTQRNILLSRVAKADRERAANLDNDIVTSRTPFRYRDMDDPIQSILQQQIHDLIYASSMTPGPLSDATFDQTTALRETFDLRGVLQKREQLRIHKFLEPANAADRKAWFNELTQYRSALQKTETSGLPGIHHYLDPGFLTRYARDHLRDQIKKDLNLEIDPDQVIVTTYELAIAYTSRGDLPSPPNARQTEKVPTRSTLTELALANTRMLDQSWGDEFPVKTVDGNALPQLTRDYLTRIIRAANIGQRYKEFLQSRLLDSAEGKVRENVYAQFLKARLLLDTREATIHGHITADSAQWIRASMTANPIKTNQERVLAHDLEIDKNKLNGILVFATPQPISMTHGLTHATLNAHRGAPKVVLYTPDAPDGKRLREYGSRPQMNRDFINNPAMRDYLLQRIDLGQRNAVSRHLENGAVDILIKDRPTAGNFLHAAYRTEVAHIIADADARTTSNDEAERQARWDRINRGLDIAGILLPVKLSIPLSLMRASYALYSANDARMHGNSDEALAEFLNGINLSLAAVSDSVATQTINVSGKLYQADAKMRPALQRPEIAPPTPAINTRTVVAPAGMSAIQIDGLSYFYWNAKNDMTHYRDLFIRDPLHPGQLKAAGYGAPDIDNIWKKIVPLKGGGNAQNRSPSPQPGSSRNAVTQQSHELLPATPWNGSQVIKITKTADQIFLSAKIAGRTQNLLFNLEKNAFRKIKDRGQGNETNTYYVVKDDAMHVLNDIHRPVTDAERTATLRALGINLSLPLDFNASPPASATPIPAVIRSIWIGKQVIPETLVDNLQHNAAMAKLGRRPYQSKLYLSTLDLDSFRKNETLLRSRAPGVGIIPLEHSTFYTTFQTEQEGKYFTQYQAALNGNGGIAVNLASAADTLRYRLMRHEGGLYMDLDDELVQAPGNSVIATTPDGLALSSPKTLHMIEMQGQYCNDIFGTQKNNPTLDAISEESYRRYFQNTDLYSTPRPRLSTHSMPQLAAYIKRISHVTGPDVFDNIIGERLPEMRQIREAIRLARNNSIEISGAMRARILAWAKARNVLSNINITGNEHSWTENK